MPRHTKAISQIEADGRLFLAKLDTDIAALQVAGMGECYAVNIVLKLRCHPAVSRTPHQSRRTPHSDTGAGHRLVWPTCVEEAADRLFMKRSSRPFLGRVSTVHETC